MGHGSPCSPPAAAEPCSSTRRLVAPSEESARKRSAAASVYWPDALSSRRWPRVRESARRECSRLSPRSTSTSTSSPPPAALRAEKSRFRSRCALERASSCSTGATRTFSCLPRRQRSQYACTYSAVGSGSEGIDRSTSWRCHPSVSRGWQRCTPSRLQSASAVRSTAHGEPQFKLTTESLDLEANAGAGQVRCMRRAVPRPIPRHSVDAEREAAAPTQRADHATLRANLAKGDALSSFNVCECWPAPLKLREAAARLPRVPHGPEDDHIYRVQGRPPTLTHTPRAVLVHRVITAHPS